MLTYQSFVISFTISSIINQSIQVLSQLIIKGSFSLNIITLSNLLIKIASFTIYNRANNSASILNVVTISYLFTLQAISPLNSFIIYPYKLFLLIELSANNTSLAQINNYASLLPSLPSSRPLLRIPLSLPLLFIPFLISPSTVYSFLISSIVDYSTPYTIQVLDYSIYYLIVLLAQVLIKPYQL